MATTAMGRVEEKVREILEPVEEAWVSCSKAAAAGDEEEVDLDDELLKATSTFVEARQRLIALKGQLPSEKTLGTVHLNMPEFEAETGALTRDMDFVIKNMADALGQCEWTKSEDGKEAECIFAFKGEEDTSLLSWLAGGENSGAEKRIDADGKEVEREYSFMDSGATASV